MPSTHWLCFDWKREEDVTDSEDESVDEDSDDDEGYHRLDSSADARPSSATEGTHNNNGGEGSGHKDVSETLCSQQSSSTDDAAVREKGRQPYAKADKKAKRLSRKLRRKEKRTRLLHLLHVTWKWCKRGFLAAAPGLGAMLSFSPASSSAYTAAVYSGRSGGKSVSVFV